MQKPTASQRRKHDVEKYIQWVTNAVAGNTDFHLAVVSYQICEILYKFELTAGQGHRSWCQSKAHTVHSTTRLTAYLM